MASTTSVSRRALGVVLLGIATLLFAQPWVLRSTAADVGVPTLADSASLVGLVPPALVAAGAVTFLSGIAAVRGRTLSARASLAAPIVCVAVGVALGVGVDPDSLATTGIPVSAVVVSGLTPFVVAGAAIGGSLAPVVLGATREDTVALLAGAILLLVGVGLAPAPALALVAGFLGGGGAIGALWVLDAESWRP
ncbi:MULTISPECIES: hypothetical protein [Haloferacaceae]|uniref:Uncharacterized protein n=1 Tax=Halorubrum glutamatedens TaxID=2707018 RepID=A0ABD5QN87_9EURY|nr:hypothetical protein [Halobellus captivus]